MRLNFLRPTRSPVPVATVALSGMLLLGGCADQTKTSAGGEAMAASEIGPANEIVEPAPLADLAGPKDRVRTYRSVLPNDSHTLRVTSSPASDGDSTAWIVTFDVMEGGGGASAAAKPQRREQHMRVLEDGSVALVREINHPDEVIVDFEPPLVIFPASLPPSNGEAPGYTQSLHVTVHPMSDETKVKVEGPATNRIWLIAQQNVMLNKSPVSATRVHAELNFDFGGTKVSNDQVAWYAPNMGLIREERLERTTLLGVRIRKNSEAWISMDSTSAAPKTTK